MQIECCVCRDWKNKENNTWFTPTSEQRRNHHFALNHRLSHTYCPRCFILDLKNEGVTEEQIIRMVKETNDNTTAHH